MSTNEQEKRSAVIEALSDMYIANYYIDLSNREFTMLSGIPYVNQVIGKCGDVVHGFDRFVQSFVEPADRERMREFLNLDTLEERMSTCRNISSKFLSIGRGWCRCSFIVVERDAKGHLVSVLFAAEDIDETRKKEMDARATIQALSFDYLNVCCVDMDADQYEICRINSHLPDYIKKVFHTTGCFSATLAAYANLWVYEEDRELVLREFDRNYMREKLETQESYHLNFRGIHNNKILYEELKCVRMDMQKGSHKAILACRIVDEEVRKDMEQRQALADALRQAEYANRAKTVFLSNMSHDMRTPMNAIIGFTELASHHLQEPERVQDYLQKITQASNHLLSLINDVLDMSHIESGKLELEEKPENLQDIIRNLQSIIQTNAEEKDLALHVDMEGIQDPLVSCDRLRLNQILLNLTSNAIKYTNPGGDIFIKVMQFPALERDYGRYEFSIRDTGIGMSQEFASHIFEPFTREKTSTISGIQGTGLGMSITKNIVEMMGGTIEVQTQAGKGTEFRVVLELKKLQKDLQKETAEEITEAEEEQQKEGFTGKRLLLTEDNELNTEIAVEILNDAGFLVDTAENGKVACEKLLMEEPGYYDMILMDIQMPVMDGYQAAQTIRKMKDPVRSRIPIIAMTANAFEEDRKRALKCGMNGHVGKPIETEKLFAEIRRLAR
jgi:signal transduction histidine kinase/BarA-like signal transduction histidine kinase